MATAGTTGKKGQIFISYRRDDAEDAAGRIRDWLIQTRRLAREDIFTDVTAILPGADFLQVIERTISQCKAMVVVISSSWLAQVNSPDTSYVRLEAETALRHNLLIIPVLVGGARMPSADQLPESLGPLTRRNARPLRADSFDYDMEWVRRALGIKGGLGIGRDRVRVVALSALLILTSAGGGAFAWLSASGQARSSAGATSTTAASATVATATATTTASAATASSSQTATAVPPAATATPLAFDTQPYFAQIPGPCDTGGARWEYNGDPIPYQCLSAGLQLSAGTYVFFYGVTGKLPLNLAVEVQVTSLKCTVFPVSFLVFYPNGTEYFLDVHPTGAWSVYGLGPEHTIGSGTVTAQGSYTLGITATGTTKSFYLNGTRIASVDDGLKGSSLGAGFGCGGNRGDGGTAEFAGFQFSPQT